MRPGLSAMLLALACAGLPGRAAAADRVILPARDITVADLAMLDTDQRTGLSALVVLAIPAGRSYLELDSAARTKLLRRRVPGQDFRLRHDGKVRFQLADPRRASPARTLCFKLRDDLNPGEYLHRGAVAPAACATNPPMLPLRFDRRVNAPYLSVPLGAGTYLGSLALRDGAVVGTGTQLRHVVRQGPVSIERTVNALQPARAGGTIFVRTQDGAVITSRLATPEKGARK